MNIISNKLPILIIAYARKANVIRMVRKLPSTHVKKIYLAVDRMIDPKLQLSQFEMIEEVRKISSENQIAFSVWFREENLGLATSMITAIDWFFSLETQGIIFEDDLDFTDSFFEFSSYALENFKSFDDVWIISGNNFFEDRGIYRWCTYPLIWGWATWGYRWAEMRNCILFNTFPKISIFDSINRFWKTGKRRAVSGNINSWAVPLAASQHAMRKKTLIPPFNLVTNLGDDIYSTHTNFSDWHINKDLTNDKLNLTDYRPDFSDFANCDSLLEKMVYRIHHYSFGRFIANFLIDFYRFRGKNSINLMDSVSRVNIPNK